MKRRNHVRGGDRGSTELAIATPLLLLILLFVVQTALWAHAGHVAQTIAQHALAATRTAGATQAQGREQAEAIADQLAGNLLTDMDVYVDRDATTARVTIRAEVPTLIPGLTWPIRQHLSGPVERYVPAVESEATS